MFTKILLILNIVCCLSIKAQAQELERGFLRLNKENIQKSETNDKDTFKYDGKMALVIGNYKYKNTPLKNPKNDVKSIAEILSFMGYQVILKENLNYKQLKEVINQLKTRNKVDVSLLYYSGHGVQINGVNYIVPIDFNKKQQLKLVSIDNFIDAVSINTNFAVTIFDACRDNPFGSYGYKSDININKKVPKNTFIAFSTKDGYRAKDGIGQYSPYTEALLQYLPHNNLTVFDLFGKVRDKVRKTTNNFQTPYTYSSIGYENLYLTNIPLLKFIKEKKIAISVNEITVREYMQCVKDKECATPEWLTYKSKFHIITGSSHKYKNLTMAEQPITGISWFDATSYTHWLSDQTKKNFRLLTNTEWQYIANKDITVNLAMVNCDGCNKAWGGIKTSPVGTFISKTGFNDLFGNVWEWVCNNKYCGKPILRGGSWMTKPKSIMSFNYLSPPPTVKDINIGFRVAVDL